MIFHTVLPISFLANYTHNRWGWVNGLNVPGFLIDERIADATVHDMRVIVDF